MLTAFGIAGTAGDPSITRIGIVLGTPGYRAPERANGMPATPAADLWSLGATLYAALCSQGPFDDRDDALATLSAIANEDPPYLTGDGSPEPAHLDRALLESCVLQPEDVSHFLWKADTFGVKVRGSASIRKFLADPHALRAIRSFNLTHMNRGRNAYLASHCYSVANHMLEA